MTRQIVDPRLAIRPWRVEDAPDLSMAIEQSLNHLRPWMSWIALEPRALVERTATIEKWEVERRSGGDLVFGMFMGDVVVGGCGLHRRQGPDALEMGYWVHANHVRKGYATCAAAMLTSLALSFHAIHHVEIHADIANAASSGVPRALGYTLVGQQPKAVQAPSETGTQDVWRIDRDQWLRGPCEEWKHG